MRPVFSPDCLYIYAPYIPHYGNFPQNSATKFVQKKFPRSPFRGDLGTVLRLLTAQKSAAIIRAKRRPHGQRPANRQHGFAINLTGGERTWTK